MLPVVVRFKYHQHITEHGYSPEKAIALIGVQYGLTQTEIVHMLKGLKKKYLRGNQLPLDICYSN